ncbi:MAG: flagellar hook-basal body complex subunit FliE [Ilumatobacteraceae bacterium]|nr:flagellar hook-basal body complex subunit FliE [Ilumatobacteraceae bacterium]
MALLPIPAINPIAVSGPLQAGNRTAADTAAPAGQSFGNVLTQQLDKLNAVQGKADDLALQAATGDLQSIQDYTIASTEAQLMTQLTVAVRNKAVEAFNDIMRMQI